MGEGMRDDVTYLLQQGHELGNHMQADLPFHYYKLSKRDFQTQLKEAEEELEKLRKISYGYGGGHKHETQTRWFRAPQGIITNKMKRCLEEEGLQNVLCDCYCDDWKFAEDMDGSNDEKCREVMKGIGEVMLTQAQPGSIACFHMPEKGLREGTIYALDHFLQ